MPTKTYGLFGITEAKLDFVNLGTTFKLTFRGGVPDPLQNRPATFSTSAPYFQAAIEHDGRFGKRIKLIRVTPTKEERLAAAKARKAAKPCAFDETPVEGGINECTEKDVKPYPGVTSLNQAREILSRDYNASAAETVNTVTCKATARRLGVEFPDWK